MNEVPEASGGSAPSTAGSESPEPTTTHWDPPGDPSPGRGRLLLIGALVVGALLIGGSLLATYFLDQTGSSEPDLLSIGFGTGGSECTLTEQATSFPPGTQIRSVLTFEPALPAGGTVTIKVDLDGAELVDLRDTVTVEEPAPCLYGTMTPAEAGHYRVEYTITPSVMPPLVGEFDVNP